MTIKPQSESGTVYVSKRRDFLLITNFRQYDTEPHSSVDSVADLRRGCWFDPQLGQYSF